MEPIPQISYALEIIENVCKISSTVYVNKHQCKRIARRFSAIGAGLTWLLRNSTVKKKPLSYSAIVRGSGNGNDSYYDPAFDVLLRILQKGDTLVSLYSVESSAAYEIVFGTQDFVTFIPREVDYATSGISNVVSRTDNHEAFKEIHDELDTIRAQFDFEAIGTAPNVTYIHSTSRIERSKMLIADAEKDLEEMPQLLANIQNPQLRSSVNMEEVTQVVVQKMKHSLDAAGSGGDGRSCGRGGRSGGRGGRSGGRGGQRGRGGAHVAEADVELPINLHIDLTTIKNTSAHHPKQSPRGKWFHAGKIGKQIKILLNGVSPKEKVTNYTTECMVQQNSNGPSWEDCDWVAVFFGQWLGCDFAIKAFQSRSRDMAFSNKKQLLKEVRPLLELRHPHIVQLVGFGFGKDSERSNFFLMELMDTNLRDFMKEKTKISGLRPFKRMEELDIITRIAKGMYYLHTKEYAHGDLKCSNILIKEFPTNFEVKISDLRFAQKLGKDWDLKAFNKDKWKRRWPRCIPPEAIHHYNDRIASSYLLMKSDVFCFGVTCYEVVTGKYPFEGLYNFEVERKIEEGIRPEWPSNTTHYADELDGNLKGLIEKCWDQDPNNRPDFARICYMLEFIKSKKSVFSAMIPRVQGLFAGFLGRVFHGKEHHSDSGISVPAYLTIQSDELKREQLIGSGSFAKVYKTSWLGCTFAEKIFEKVEPSNFPLLQQEVDFLIRLRHPFVVQLVGFCVHSEQRCSIVMEYMRGNLRKLIEPPNLGFSLRDTVLIIFKIALGMQFLHFAGVMHRDLKCTNVLAEKHPDGRIDVKIVDFGVSQYEDVPESGETPPSTFVALEEEAQTPTRIPTQNPLIGVGTRFWRAPEILPTPEAKASKILPDLKAADVYSFAMTCYEVLTGKIPMSDLGEDLRKAGKKYYLQAQYAAVIKGYRPQLPSSVHPKLTALIKKCWDGEPKQRPSFSEICEELQRIEQALTN